MRISTKRDRIKTKIIVRLSIHRCEYYTKQSYRSRGNKHYCEFLSYSTLETVIFQEVLQSFFWTFLKNSGMVLCLERQVSTMTTLENLYYGNIAPHNYEVPRDSEYYVTAQQVVRYEKELSATLTEQQKEILQKIKDNHTELLYLGERNAFCRGFSLAVKLITEAMSGKT